MGAQSATTFPTPNPPSWGGASDGVGPEGGFSLELKNVREVGSRLLVSKSVVETCVYSVETCVYRWISKEPGTLKSDPLSQIEGLRLAHS